jgi:hypothetical protein
MNCRVIWLKIERKRCLRQASTRGRLRFNIRSRGSVQAMRFSPSHFHLAFALTVSACGVANSDPSLWQQSRDIGGKQFQLPGGGDPMSGSGGDGTGAGGAPTMTPGGAGGDQAGAGNAPAAGGLSGAGGAGIGGMPFPGAGGFITGAGGFMVIGAGGSMTGAGGFGVGAGGATGAGGMVVGGNSGKCTFSFDVTTVTARGLYAPRNVGAIWITDSSSKFVKTLRVWGSIRLGNATAWTTSTGSNRTDAVSGATRTSHGMLNATWDCTDVSKNPVADGAYVVHVTFAENDANPFFGGTPIQTSVNFNKSSSGANVMGTDTANFTSMHVKLTVP